MKNIRITGKLLRNIVFLCILFFATVLSSYLSIYNSDLNLAGGIVVSHFYINLVFNILSSVLVVVLAWLLVSFLYRFDRGFVVATGFSLLFMIGIFLFSIDSLKREEAIANQNSALAQGGENGELLCVEDVEIRDNALRLIMPVNAALSLFLPSSQYSVATYEIHNYFSFHLYYLLIYFFFSFLFLSLLGRRLLNKISAILIPFKYSNMFWGYSNGAMVLGAEIAKSSNNDEAIFVLFNDLNRDPTKTNLIFDKINHNKAIALFENSEKSFSKRLYKAYRHFFMTEDQDFNIRMAWKLADEMKNSSKNISIYIFAEMESVSTLFKDFRDSNIDIHIYNYADLTARSFVAQYPILRHNKAFESKKIEIDDSRVKGNFNILLLGFGSTGFEILNKSLCDAQFAKDFNLKLTCIDRDYDLQHSKYKPIFADASDYGYSLEVNPSYLGGSVSNPSSQLFYDWLGKDNKILDFDRVIICLGEDKLNIQTALRLVKYRMKFQTKEDQFENVFVHLRNFSKYKYYNYTESNMITMFGGDEAVNTFRLIVNEELDQLAKLVNFVYSKSRDLKECDFKQKEVESQWKLCSLFDKDSSRAVAMNINNMLYLAGEGEPFAAKLKDASMLDYFAELEHLRWCAFLYMNYVRKWDFEDVNTLNGKQIFNDVLLRHIAQVKYDDLGFSENDEVDLFDKTKASGFLNYKRKLAKPDIESDNLVNYQASARRILRHFPLLLEIKKQLNKNN